MAVSLESATTKQFHSYGLIGTIDDILNGGGNIDSDFDFTQLAEVRLYDINADTGLGETISRTAIFFNFKGLLEIIFTTLPSFVTFIKTSKDEAVSLTCSRDNAVITISGSFVNLEDEHANMVEIMKIVTEQYIIARRQHIKLIDNIGFFVNDSGKDAFSFFIFPTSK